MQFQQLLKFPAALQRARIQQGMAQKSVALTIGVDQAHYCGVEKGRRPPFGEEAIVRLAATLKLGRRELNELKWAARHDRCIRVIHDASVPYEDVHVVSSALSVSRQLDTPQRSGLCSYLETLEISAGQMRALELHGSTASAEEGEAQ